MNLTINKNQIQFTGDCASKIPCLDSGFLEPITDTIDNMIAFFYTEENLPTTRKIQPDSDGFYIHHSDLASALSVKQSQLTVEWVESELVFLVDIPSDVTESKLNWVPERDGPLPISSREAVFKYPTVQVFKLQRGKSGGTVGIAFEPDIHSKQEVVDLFFQENIKHVKSRSLRSLCLEAGNQWSSEIRDSAERFAPELFDFSEYSPDRSPVIESLISEKGSECMSCGIARSEQITEFGRDFSVNVSQETVLCSKCQSKST